MWQNFKPNFKHKFTFLTFLAFCSVFYLFWLCPNSWSGRSPQGTLCCTSCLIQNGEWWKCRIVSSAPVDQLATEYIILYNSDCGPVWMNFSCHIYSGLAISYKPQLYATKCSIPFPSFWRNLLMYSAHCQRPGEASKTDRVMTKS